MVVRISRRAAGFNFKGESLPGQVVHLETGKVWGASSWRIYLIICMRANTVGMID